MGGKESKPAPPPGAPKPSSATGTESRTAGRQRLLDEYTVAEVLGDGAFGVVYACKKRDTGEDFAVKMVDKVETPVHLIKKEAEMLQKMDHPNVVKFRKVVYEKCFVCIVMDMYKGGDVVDGMQLHHKTTGKIPSTSIPHIARQMCQALNYLHSQLVVHRDVKGDNFLMDRKDLSDPKCHIALSDFGTARKITADERLHEECGTKLFWSPEFCGRNYSLKVDTWATGVIMYGLLDGRFPFKDEKDIKQKQIKLPKGTPEACENFVHGMLTKEEAKRFSANEALEHAWLAGSSAPEPTPGPAQDPAWKAEAPLREERKLAVAERRRELVERMEDVAQGRTSQAERLRAEKHFWKPAFTVLDRHAGNAAFRFEWWSSRKMEEREVLKLDGAQVTGAALPAQENDPSETVRNMLADHGISIEPFGKGEAKSFTQLVDEIQRGASRLQLDAAQHKKLVRVVDVVLLRICVGSGGDKRFLIEKAEQFPDGRTRGVTRLPGTKKEPTENTKMTAKRILTDLLNMGDCKMLFDLKSKDVFEEEEDSPSYPGMLTVYRKEVVECMVSTTDPEVLERIGLPTGSEWSFQDSRGNIKFFEWLSEAECESKSVKMRAPEDQDVSGLVQAPVGLGEEALRDFLQSAQVDISKFGQDHTKTLKEFSSELQKGESSLMKDGSGAVVRVADIVLVQLKNKAEETLVQTEKSYPDGHREAMNRLPGTKRRPDENQFLTAWRVLRKQLKMDENYVHLDPASVKVYEEEKASQQYPGIRTVYRKRIITAELAPPESA